MGVIVSPQYPLGVAVIHPSVLIPSPRDMSATKGKTQPSQDDPHIRCQSSGPGATCFLDRVAKIRGPQQPLLGYCEPAGAAQRTREPAYSLGQGFTGEDLKGWSHKDERYVWPWGIRPSQGTGKPSVPPALELSKPARPLGLTGAQDMGMSDLTSIHSLQESGWRGRGVGVG